MAQTENQTNLTTERERQPFFPTCRYCGSVELPIGNYESQEQADEAAVLYCKCAAARAYREELERIKERENNIVKLRQKLDDFSSYCEDRGVDLEGELYDTVFNAGVAVLDGIIVSVTFKFLRLKVAISTNSKGALVIAFTYSDGAKVEV